MNTDSIGRWILFRFVCISVILFFLVNLLLFVISADAELSLSTVGILISNLAREIDDNLGFIAIQIVFIIVLIYFVGGQMAKRIIKEGRNSTVVGSLSIFVMWIFLFISCALTSGLINSIEYGIEGFFSALSFWMIFGMLLFVFIGLCHGLIMGYFLGKAVKDKGAI